MAFSSMLPPASASTLLSAMIFMSSKSAESYISFTQALKRTHRS